MGSLVLPVIADIFLDERENMALLNFYSVLRLFHRFVDITAVGKRTDAQNLLTHKTTSIHAFNSQWKRRLTVHYHLWTYGFPDNNKVSSLERFTQNPRIQTTIFSSSHITHLP